MRNVTIPFLVMSLLSLSACQTSSLSDAENAPLPATDTPFSGTVREIDRTQSVISFTGKSNIINHEGKFNQYTAAVTLDSLEPANLEKASVTAELDMNSITVDAAGLQDHLKKDDFFAVATYPVATFESTGIVKKEGNLYGITGDLTVKGVTKMVTIDAEITDDYLSAQYDFPRAEFGVGNDAYGEKLLEPVVPVNVKLVFLK
ncbi:MAG: YceI family protein [Candidatus Peribacteraceae bacterium]|nr:YceI family protein [Candidatus Peribacteraceae bacterium]